MFAEFGYGILLLAFLVAVYAVVAAAMGVRRKSISMVESARRALLLTFPLISIAALSLIYLLVNNHFEVSFVYEVTSRSMPTYLRVTAWWGGQAGSLVFWSFLMSAFSSAVTLRKWNRDVELLPWVIVVCGVTLAFFIGLVVFYENPFTRYWLVGGEVQSYMFAPSANATIFFPEDGRGLNPLLRHPGMIIHPPMLYLGFVSFVIPYAFAMAALITGRADDRWIRLTRRWTLWAWLFLSCGLVLGGRWAYDVLGWGGYWGWDPVEIAAFMPWLTGTAFLHSVMIQEKRGQFKHWNMILVILTYSLVIFGTFLTRSGVLSSVHSFAQSAIGPLFFAFIGITFGISITLLIRRWPELQSETEIKSMLSREALFLANNLLFMAILVVCLWGVIFPIISELSADTICHWFPILNERFTCAKQTVGPPFYERANAPLFSLLLLLMAIAPLSAWGQSSSKQLDRRGTWTLGALLALPTALFIFLWKPITFELGDSAITLSFVVVILLTIFLLYMFWRSVWLSTIIAILGTTILYATYTRNISALLGFFLVILAVSLTLREFIRATLARMRVQNERLYTAFSHLIARDRRRYGGYIVHLSIALMGIGILGVELFQIETQGTVSQGGSLDIANYTVEYRELASWDDIGEGVNYTRAVVDVYRNGVYLGELHPRIDYYYDSQQNMTIPGNRSSLRDDLYILLVDWQPVSNTGATFKVYVNPLINWLWLASLLFLAGIIVAAWPEPNPEHEAVRISQRAGQTSAAD
jgi:cytochrome c-type biogenesis protein CcmF